MNKYILRCADCGSGTPEDRYYVACPACGGFLEVEFAATPAVAVDDRYPSIFKHHPVMPFDPSTEDIAGFETIEPTPVVFAERLSTQLGIELFFKDETAMPTGTWKDREGFVSMHRLLINGVEDLVVFSSGNTGTSLARSASLVRGPRIHLVIPTSSKDRVAGAAKFFDPDFVKVHFFAGSNDECVVEAGKLAQTHGYVSEGGFANYARREGLKLLALEILSEWGKPIDWYVQPVAGGIGIYSYEKAYRDLGRRDACPRLLGVQAEICAPMANAWRADAPTLEPRFVPADVVPSAFVRVLRTRNPAGSYHILKRIMDRVDGRFESVSDAQILAGLQLFYVDDYFRDVYRSRGTIVGLEPATALAGVAKGVETGYIEQGARVLLNVSGAAKSGDVRREWLSGIL